MPYACRVYLLRPLTSYTVFGLIAQTPIYHFPAVHDCVGRPIVDETSDNVNVEDVEEPEPPVRPAEKIRQLSVTEHGWLLPGRLEMTHRNPWYTQLELYNTCVQNMATTQSAYGTEHYLDTIMEILKLEAYHQHPDAAKQRDKKRREFKLTPVDRDGVTMYAFPLGPRGTIFELVVLLDEEQLRAFVRKVSQRFARSHNVALIPRLAIVFYGGPLVSAYHSLLDPDPTQH